ncbi:MAG: Coenzyme F420 hydrogenase/dehydrogenase, beta subunit C-terminal domain, partial [Victivallales bacterium]|nr:Coenzyme F420 hydrogenase/dehydrogenase, beta subunit C-terminal domain [Victivallales bacterium]
MIASNTIAKIASYESKCTGCGACSNVCPKGAIRFVERRGYFRFPEIDENLCTQCGLCLKKCPVVTANPQSTGGDGVFPLIYGTYVKDAEIRARSSSGGMFSVLANYVLDKGGVVCGAAFTSGCKLEHVIVERQEDLAPLRGSKYLQSDTGLVYKRIKAHLDAGRIALFCGTPCQVAAMKAVAGPSADKLYTVDFFCHGVPPQKLFEEYVNAITDGKASSARNISFRLKNPEGWKNYHIRIDYDGGSYESYGRQDPYVNGFVSKLFLRKSCGNCHFAHIPREGDFTVGDAWGLAEEQWGIRDNKGVSIICINNEHARAVFEQVKSNFAYCVKTSPDAVQKTNNFKSHTYLHTNSPRFMDWLEGPHDKQEIASKILEYLDKDDNVAIMNFYESRHNYGSVITGYALQEKVKRILGYSPLHIQKCDGFNDDISDLRDFCKEHILETSPCHSSYQLEGLNRHFRSFIAGPDIVWINAGFFPNFYSFLFDFASFSKNICSYAPSFRSSVLMDIDPHTWREKPVA